MGNIESGKKFIFYCFPFLNIGKKNVFLISEQKKIEKPIVDQPIIIEIDDMNFKDWRKIPISQSDYKFETLPITII